MENKTEINAILKTQFNLTHELYLEYNHDLYYRGMLDAIASVYSAINGIELNQARKELTENAKPKK